MNIVIPNLNNKDVQSLLSLHETMTLRQLSVLMFIAQNPNCTARTISTKMGIPYESACKVAMRLNFDAGLVEMIRDPDDERTNLIRISKQAKEILI